jgi:DNA-binding HxlR family transcriptional regulator
MPEAAHDEPSCSIERSLLVLGERWTLLIIRDIHLGRHRFAEIQASLGIAPNLLSSRLKTLVGEGVLRKQTYRLPGSRPRDSYHLTPAGEELQVVLAALQQWGDRHRPRPSGPTTRRRQRSTGRPVHMGFISDDDAREVAPADIELVWTQPDQPQP